MKFFRWTCMCILGGLVLTGAATLAKADAWNKKTYVTTSQSIEVPGAVLPPGKYVFKLLNSETNRHIVQIMNERENHVYATNLAIPKQRMEPADKTVLTFYEMPGGGPEPIRSWFYPGDTIGQEFAYPSSRAMEISRAMKQEVPTLAEAGEPAPSTTPAETPVPAVEPSTTAAVSTPPSEVEEPAPVTPAPVAESQPVPEAQPEPEQEAAAQQPSTPTDGTSNSTPAEPKMPKTAGNSAAMGLIGLSSLAVAVSLRLLGSRS
jgi:hypothetical protein